MFNGGTSRRNARRKDGICLFAWRILTVWREALRVKLNFNIFCVDIQPFLAANADFGAKLVNNDGNLFNFMTFLQL